MKSISISRLSILEFSDENFDISRGSALVDVKMLSLVGLNII
jgi:hypothetical protein